LENTDAGNTWQNISDGFFGGSVGAVAISESDNNVIYVGKVEKTVRGNVFSRDGIWKSENAGKTWKHIGLKKSRYIPRVRIHPTNSDIIFAGVLGDLYKPTQERGVYKSIDGGKTYSTYNAPHRDHHDLWIAPEDNQRMIIGDDGGAQVSFDTGENWSTYMNQPTSQFYRVTTDNHFPYRILAAQQDNSTVRISH
jgi:photosystem II stability/assembly factor-like uncharacterized protein